MKIAIVHMVTLAFTAAEARAAAAAVATFPFDGGAFLVSGVAAGLSFLSPPDELLDSSESGIEVSPLLVAGLSSSLEGGF